MNSFIKNFVQTFKGQIILMLFKQLQSTERNDASHFMTQAYPWYQNLAKEMFLKNFTHLPPSTVSLSTSAKRALLSFTNYSLNYDYNVYFKYASLRTLIHFPWVPPPSSVIITATELSCFPNTKRLNSVVY